jgi:kynureninase
LEFIINYINDNKKSFLEIITPKNPKERGCQLSIIAHGYGRDLFEELSRNHVVVDWREPNVIRVAPVPFYNCFEDVFELGRILNNYVK